MYIYNPEFFNNVSPKFLRIVDKLLQSMQKDDCSINYIHMKDFGAGTIPAVLFVNTNDDRARKLNRTLKAWSQFSDTKACVKIGTPKNSKPIFVKI